MARKKNFKIADEPENYSFVVDKDALDIEWEHQPELAHSCFKSLADAREVLNEADRELDVARAELSQAIRDRPNKYGLEKVTEEAIKSAILLDEGYQEFLRALNRAKHHVDICVAATKGAEHKKAAIENLVYLHGQDYFSSPRVSKAGGEAVAERAKSNSRRKLGKKREDLNEED